MATKEATVYVVDVGASMSEKKQGRTVTDLEWAMEYVWDKITTTVATDRKTAHVGVIALKTDDTLNELDGEEAYQNISVLQPLKQVLMPDLRNLRTQIHTSSTDAGDAISALIIAIQMISAHCKQLQYQRRIVLVTNGQGAADADDLEGITSKLKADKIELVIIGVDFDDAEYGFKEEDKDETKAINEATFRKLADDCDGIFGTAAQAIAELSIPRLKTVRPVHSYKGFLTLGNPEIYDTAMAIDVERYPRTMVARAPTASSFVIKSDMAAGESTQGPSTQEAANQDGLAAVKSARTYQVPDESAPGGKKDVEQEDLAKGYTYGSTAVYISESDRTVTNYESQAGLDIIGFVAKEDYDRYMDMSRANVIIAQRTNDKAVLALSSFVHALHELDSYAVARFVSKENKPPSILLLAPHIDVDIECLYDVELPFQEDVRSYRFPPLDRIVTVSGKELKQHRNLPKDALLEAMSDYVDSMMLVGDKDEEGNPAEAMPIEDTYSPVLHRVNQAIRHRAVYPNSEIPPIPETLIKASHPPPSLLEASQPALTRLIAASEVKKVPPKLLSRKTRRDAPKPLSGLDVSALLADSDHAGKGPARISSTNAIPEFKQAVQREGLSLSDIHALATQMAEIVKGYVSESMGDSGYGRAVEALGVLREEMVELEEGVFFNELLRGIKGDVMEEKLGGERREFWVKVRAARLGLILENAKVSEEEARKFLGFKM